MAGISQAEFERINSKYPKGSVADQETPESGSLREGAGAQRLKENAGGNAINCTGAADLLRL